MDIITVINTISKKGLEKRYIVKSQHKKGPKLMESAIVINLHRSRYGVFSNCAFNITIFYIQLYIHFQNTD
jgi:hypothetical protein